MGYDMLTLCLGLTMRGLLEILRIFFARALLVVPPHAHIRRSSLASCDDAPFAGKQESQVPKHAM